MSKAIWHRLTRYDSGQWDGYARCGLDDEVWQVEWTTPSGRRTRARRINPAVLLGRCTGCGRWITYEDLVASGVEPEG